MVVNKRIQFRTQGSGHVLDITDKVSRQLRTCGLQNGIVTLFTPSSTSALTTIEYESGAVYDLQQLFDRIGHAGVEDRD